MGATDKASNDFGLERDRVRVGHNETIESTDINYCSTFFTAVSSELDQRVERGMQHVGHEHHLAVSFP